MPTDFTATITDPERAEEWVKILGTKTVYIQSPLPKMANLPGHPHALIYMLDLATLTTDQRARLVAHLAAKFNMPLDLVDAALEAEGVPILADDCTIAIYNPQRWF